MVAIVRAARRRPETREAAVGIFKEAGLEDTHDRNEQIAAVQKWIQHRITFIRDPIDNETVSAPDRTLQCGYGDCDDQAVLSASLLGSVGVKCRFVLLGNADYEHVLTEAFNGSAWIPIETIIKDFPTNLLPKAKKYCRIEIDK